MADDDSNKKQPSLVPVAVAVVSAVSAIVVAWIGRPVGPSISSSDSYTRADHSSSTTAAPTEAKTYPAGTRKISQQTSTGTMLTNENSVDPNWTVNNGTAFLITPNVEWIAAQPSLGSSAQWIGPQSSSGNNLISATTYTYSYEFDGDDIASVSGEFASDNEASIYLNGSSLGIENKFDDSFLVLKPFTFRPIPNQSNTITFVVQNSYGGGSSPHNLEPSPTGLYVKFTQVERVSN